MSSPSSTPFYGLFVHTLPLILAAQAWPKLKGPLKALDWISARRTDGVLDIEEGSETLKTVPSEVWEMIKRELVQEALPRGEERVVGLCFDEECDNCFPSGLSYKQAATLEIFQRCEPSFDSFLDNGGLGAVLHTVSANTMNLLRSFGLRLVDVLAIEPSGDCHILDSLTPITILSLPVPMPLQPLSPSSTSNQPARSVLSASAVPLGTPPLPVLPSDAPARFAAFVSTFPLKPCHLSLRHPTHDSATLAYCFKLDDETSELLSVREGDLMAGQGRGEDMMNEVGAAVSQTSSAPRWVGWETERAGDGS